MSSPRHTSWQPPGIEASDPLQPGEMARLTFWSDQRVTLWQETQNLVTRWIRGLVERRT